MLVESIVLPRIENDHKLVTQLESPHNDMKIPVLFEKFAVVKFRFSKKLDLKFMKVFSNLILLK